MSRLNFGSRVAASVLTSLSAFDLQSVHKDMKVYKSIRSPSRRARLPSSSAELVSRCLTNRISYVRRGYEDAGAASSDVAPGFGK